jgi:hypothetical protein
MAARPLEQQTYLPKQPEEAADGSSFLDAHEAARGAWPAPRHVLVGAGEYDSVGLPASVHRVLRQVLEQGRLGRLSRSLLKADKGLTGLDGPQVRRWPSWHRWTIPRDARPRLPRFAPPRRDLAPLLHW